MRAGLIIYGSLDTISGGYLYDRRLVDSLRRRGDEVEIISLPWRSYGRHLADNLSPALRRRLEGGRFDVLLQDELNHPSLTWINRWLRGRVAYPLVALVHHLRCSEARPAWQNRLYRWAERQYLHGVDGFVFNSATTRRTVEALVGSGRPSVVARPGGDRFGASATPAMVRRRAAEPGPLRLLFVGNVIPRKGLPMLLHALGRLDRSTWRLTVVGSLEIDAHYVRTIRRQIAVAGLTGAVRLRGALTDAELAACLTEGQVLAVPSSYEGFGIVYLEAMGFGLPVIATTAGAAGEIVADGENGFLVAPGDVSSLAGRIKELHDDRARLATMSLAAHACWAAQPTWEQTTARIHDFLSDLIQTRWPPVPSGPARGRGA